MKSKIIIVFFLSVLVHCVWGIEVDVNSQISPIQKVVNSTPDFIITSVSGPSSVLPGQSVSILVTCKNQGGTSSQTGYVILRMIFSPDNSINLADTYYQDYNIPSVTSLSAGSSFSYAFNYTVPSSLSGTYYLGAYIDAGTYFTEANEGNNAYLGNTVSIVTPPSTPTNVNVAYQSSNNRNYLTWSAVSGATSYKIYWSTVSGVSTSSSNQTTTTTDFAHTGVSAGYTYYYKVAAVNSAGQSSLSSEVSVNIPAILPDLVATRSYMASISTPGTELVNPKVGDIVRFNCEFRLDRANINNNFKVNCYLDNNSSPYFSTTFNGAVGGSTYYPQTDRNWTVLSGSHNIRWVIDADNSISESAETNNEISRSWIIAQQFDLKATAASIVDINGSAITGFIGQTVYPKLNYSVIGQGLTSSFDVRCMVDNNVIFTKSGISNTGGLDYNIASTTGFVVTSGVHTIKWTLDYNNSLSESDETNNDASMGWSAQNIPSVPTNFSAIYQSANNRNYLTWSAVSGATSYKIYWSTTPGVTTTNTNAPQTTYTTDFGHTGVQPGYTYYYRVAAVNSAGESSLSSEVNVRVPFSSGFISISQGINISPAQVIIDRDFSVGFTLKEIQGVSVTLESINVTILKSDGTKLFDLKAYSNITIGANGSWLPPSAPIGQIFSPNPAGTYKVVIRGKVAGGDWFDFSTTGAGINSISINVVKIPGPLPLPQLTLSSVTVKGGDIIIVSGKYLTPNNAAQLSFVGGNGDTNVSVNADALGMFNYNYTVPINNSNQNSTQSVRVTDNVSGLKSVNKDFTVMPSTTTQSYLSIVTPTAGLSYQATRAFNITFEDMMQAKIGGYTYPMAPGNPASRLFSYNIECQIGSGGQWQVLKTETGSALKDTRITKSLGLTINTINNYCQVRVKDNYCNTIIANSGVFSTTEYISRLKTEMVWDKSFPIVGNSLLGVAADGTARVYIKISKLNQTISAIKDVTVTLEEAGISNSTTLLGKIMMCNDTVYSLEANIANSLTATDNSADEKGKFWFWYVAPDDFSDSSTPLYVNAKKRDITAKITANMVDGTVENQDLKITIVRPPLVMVHGLGGGSNSWDEFKYSVGGGITNKFINNSSLWLQKQAINLDPQDSYNNNANSLLNSYDKINSLQGNIEALRDQGYASNRVDYVCHSMGGCVMRTAINTYYDKFYSSGAYTNNVYKSYGKGFINKAITINTPHNNSPLADLITNISEKNFCNYIGS